MKMQIVFSTFYFYNITKLHIIMNKSYEKIQDARKIIIKDFHTISFAITF